MPATGKPWCRMSITPSSKVQKPSSCCCSSKVYSTKFVQLPSHTKVTPSHSPSPAQICKRRIIRVAAIAMRFPYHLQSQLLHVSALHESPALARARVNLVSSTSAAAAALAERFFLPLPLGSGATSSLSGPAPDLVPENHPFAREKKPFFSGAFLSDCGASSMFKISENQTVIQQLAHNHSHPPTPLPELSRRLADCGCDASSSATVVEVNLRARDFD